MILLILHPLFHYALVQGQYWKACPIFYDIGTKVIPNIVQNMVNIPNPESSPKMPFYMTFVFFKRSSSILNFHSIHDVLTLFPCTQNSWRTYKQKKWLLFHSRPCLLQPGWLCFPAVFILKWRSHSVILVSRLCYG